MSAIAFGFQTYQSCYTLISVQRSSLNGFTHNNIT